MRGSMATTAPTFSGPSSQRAASCWRSRSIDRVRFLPGDRRVALVLLEELAAAVDDHHPLAVLAAQLGVVGLLDPLLADHVARLVGALRLLDLLGWGLAQVAEDVGGLLAVAVEAQVLDLDLELRVLEPLDAEAGHLGEGEVLGEEHRLEHRHAAVLLEDLLQLGHRPAEHAGGEPEAVLEVAARLRSIIRL